MPRRLGGRLEWVLAIGVLDFALEQAIVAPALAAMLAEYATTPTSVVWVITGFLVAAAVATPLAGRLGDRYGRRLLLLVSLALFAAGALVCALGDSIGVVIAGRVIQGLGAGVGPLAVALIRDHTPSARVPRAIGLLVGVAGLGSTLGLLSAGVLVDNVSVESIFWLLFAVAALLALAVWLWVPEGRIDPTTNVDWIGGVLLAGALAALMLAISQGNGWGWDSTSVLGLFTGSVVLMALFVAREHSASQPLIEPALLARRPVWSANLAMFAAGFAMFVAFALIPLIGGLPEQTGYGLGLSTTGIALIGLPASLGTLVAGPLGGRFIDRVGARPQILVAGLLAVASYAGFVVLGESVTAIMLALVPLGIGIGLAFGAILDLVAVSVAQERTGAALGITNVIRALAGALGAQVAVAVYTAAPELAAGVPAKAGIDDAFLMGLVATLVATAAFVFLPRRHADPVAGMATATARA